MTFKKREIEKFDGNGNVIYFKNSDGEVWNEYNENNKEIHTKRSDGYEFWYEYDEKGRLTYYKQYDGSKNAVTFESWYEYDSRGVVTEATEEEFFTKKEFKERRSRRQEKEFLSREFISIFELMEL